MPKPGRDFEEAVLAFVQTLDPQAEVIFDHKVPDRDTGTPRQCDVWIKAKFAGHWPLSILVSCKDHSRKLDVGDIGKFINEVRSTGASTGVIYSKSGFTKPAIRKAEVNGLSCCRLYQSEPTDMPGVLLFDSYACTPRIGLALMSSPEFDEPVTWSDIFDIAIEPQSNVLKELVGIYYIHEHKAVEDVKQTGQFPADWGIDTEISGSDPDTRIVIRIQCTWKKYKGKIEASLVNGSYSVSNNSFFGSQSTPWIDTQSEHPGEHWVEITNDEIDVPINRMIAISYHGNVEQALRNKLGPMFINQK